MASRAVSPLVRTALVCLHTLVRQVGFDQNGFDLTTLFYLEVVTLVSPSQGVWCALDDDDDGDEYDYVFTLGFCKLY